MGLWHVLRMLPERLPLGTLFAELREDWDSGKGEFSMTWRKHVKNLINDVRPAMLSYIGLLESRKRPT